MTLRRWFQFEWNCDAETSLSSRMLCTNHWLLVTFVALSVVLHQERNHLVAKTVVSGSPRGHIWPSTGVNIRAKSRTSVHCAARGSSGWIHWSDICSCTRKWTTRCIQSEVEKQTNEEEQMTCPKIAHRLVLSLRRWWCVSALIYCWPMTFKQNTHGLIQLPSAWTTLSLAAICSRWTFEPVYPCAYMAYCCCCLSNFVCVWGIIL